MKLQIDKYGKRTLLLNPDDTVFCYSCNLIIKGTTYYCQQQNKTYCYSCVSKGVECDMELFIKHKVMEHTHFKIDYTQKMEHEDGVVE